MAKYKKLPYQKKHYYEVFRSGQRYTNRYFDNFDEALEYYDEVCKRGNFNTVYLQEYVQGRKPYEWTYIFVTDRNTNFPYRNMYSKR